MLGVKLFRDTTVDPVCTIKKKAYIPYKVNKYSMNFFPNMMGKNTLKTEVFIIILLFVCLVIIKTTIVLLWAIDTPIMYYDELLYAKGAESFIHSWEINFQGNPINTFPPLYSIAISPAYLFVDPKISYLAIIILNGIMFSTLIFPIWFLAKMFLTKAEALLVAILVTFFLPFNYSYLFTIMSENLFIPLIALSVLFLLLSITNSSLLLDAICGFIFGLTYLTKTTGLPLVPTYIVCLVIYSMLSFRDLNSPSIWYLLQIDFLKYLTKDLIRKWVVFGSFCLTILPWIVRNIQVFAPSTSNTFSKIVYGVIGRYGKYGNEVSLFTIGDFSVISTLQEVFSQFFLHLSYTILALNIFLFIFVLFAVSIITKKIQVEKGLTLFTISTVILLISCLVIVSIHIYFFNIANPDSFQYLRARYIDPIVPLLIVLGFVGISRFNKSNNNSKYFILPILFSGCVLLMAPPIFLLAPINTIMIQYLAKLSLFEYFFVVVSVLILTALIIYLKKTINIRGIAVICAILFIISSSSAYSFIRWSSSTQYTADQNEIISWVNNKGFDEKTVFIIDNQTNPQAARDLVNALTFFTSAKYYTGVVTPHEKVNTDYYISDLQLNYSYLSEVYKTDDHYIYHIQESTS